MARTRISITVASARGSRKNRNFFWHEYKAPDKWIEHILGDMDENQQGTDIADIDGDGWIDIISGNHWYRNSQDPRRSPFPRFQYRQVDQGFHDVAVAEIDGDGRLDIVTLSESHGVYWYQKTGDPSSLWLERRIASQEHCPRSGLFLESGNQGAAHLDYLENLRIR